VENNQIKLAPKTEVIRVLENRQGMTGEDKTHQFLIRNGVVVFSD